MTNKLARLVEINRQTKATVEEVITLITETPLDGVPLSEIATLKHLFSRLFELTDNAFLLNRVSLDENVQNTFEFLDVMRTILFMFQTIKPKNTNMLNLYRPKLMS